MLTFIVTTLLGAFHDVAALPRAIGRALDDEPLLCACADGWECADCSLLGPQ